MTSPEVMGDSIIVLAQPLGIGRRHAVGPDVGTPALLFAAPRSQGLFESFVVGSGATGTELAAGGTPSAGLHKAAEFVQACPRDP
jgi:hypothetical protein